jgi:hypothetical protein
MVNEWMNAQIHLMHREVDISPCPPPQQVEPTTARPLPAKTARIKIILQKITSQSPQHLAFAPSPIPPHTIHKHAQIQARKGGAPVQGGEEGQGAPAEDLRRSTGGRREVPVHLRLWCEQHAEYVLEGVEERV